MKVTATMVRELRERTGIGMMECKHFLAEADGDMERAIELLRKSGQGRADKKAGRVAAEGMIAAETDGKDGYALVEVNCETDFVARSDQFQGFSKAVAQAVLRDAPADLMAVSELVIDGGTVESVRSDIVGKIGENVRVRRFERVSLKGDVASVYLHGGRIGVLVDMSGGDEGLARDVAMHIAASRPLCVSEHDMPAEVLDKEKEVLAAQAEEQVKSDGKPPEIAEKMVQGRVRKFLSEVTLLGQPFVKDPDQSVGKLLKSRNATVNTFYRFEVGEGIEKKQENFAEEVEAQVKAAEA